MTDLPLLLLAETTRSDLRWHALPPLWVVVLLVIPAVVLVGWWGYRRERDLTTGRRLLLGGLRSGALLLFLLALFGPYFELSEMQTVRSHLIAIVDASDSMTTEDGYEPDDAEALAKASGSAVGDVPTTSRFDLARQVLLNPASRLAEKWTADHRLHVYTFGSQLTPLVTTGDAIEGEPGDEAPKDTEDAGANEAESVRRALLRAKVGEPSTRLGQAVSTVLDTFRLRDEPVAGVIVISDGQNNAGTPDPPAAGRKAGGMSVPIYAVGVGDPRSPRNVSVANLRAKEVVLARDTALFEFSVRAKGFEGRPARIEISRIGDDGTPNGRPLAIAPDAVVLTGGDDEQHVKVAHVFRQAGTYALRIGIPPQPEERIESDNWITHTIRVIDRKIKVLYIEGRPRWEYLYLSNALMRDQDTMLVHTLLLSGDADSPQRASRTPGWDSLDVRLGIPGREALFEYDVVILGDVDPYELAPTPSRAEQAWGDLHEFVEKGGGLVMLAGPQHNPSQYRDNPLSALLPVVIDRTAEATDPEIDSSTGFSLHLTAEGERSPLMMVGRDLEESRQVWEQRDDWRKRQYWAYPALRAKTLARVLAVAAAPQYINKHGPRPVIATMRYGRGQVLFIGVEELWRMRREREDTYFYRFYGEAVRHLATYKLLGGNKRFKILTDRDTYALDDPVTVTLNVLDRDYKESTEPSQTVRLDMPGEAPGTRETIDLVVPAAGEKDPGGFRKTIVPTRSGQYRLSAQVPGPDEEPAEKLFSVVRSSLEGRDLLLDEATLGALAQGSEGGRYLRLWDLPTLQPQKRSKPVPTDVRPDDLWDDAWTLLAALGLLGAEWLLRKRYQLV